MTEPGRKTVNLDAARAARAEKLGPAPVVIIDGEELELARELPMEAILVVAEGLGNSPKPELLRSALEGLFGEHWPRLRPKLSVQDSMYLLTEILELYGGDLPEPSASPSS